MFSQIAVSGQIQEPRNSNILIWEILPRSAQCSQTPGFEWKTSANPTSPGRTPPKGLDWIKLPNSSGKHHSADQSAQIRPPAPSARRHRQQTTPHRRRARKPHRSAAHQPTAPQPPTAAPPASRGSGSARAASSTRRTPAATPVRRRPDRACPQRGTASRTRTRRTQSRAHR